MADIKVPSKKEFKSLIGHSTFGRVFKTKGGFDDIYKCLTALESYPGPTKSRFAAVRALRRACIVWLTANMTNQRSSKAGVNDLLTKSNALLVSLAEYLNFGSQSASNNSVAITNVPKLPFGKEITGADVKRIGNQLHAGLDNEMKSRHWGPGVAGRMNQGYLTYKNGGGLLSIGAWADNIFLINAEDDPSGMYTNQTQVNTTLAREVRDGVKYCTEEERADYKITMQGGLLYDSSGTLYDTTSRQTHFSGFGWAIFVLGFDNVLYSNTHLVNTFHHSSFFAGQPVQCGGEICCIAGKVRYLTNKTGHYRSSKFEFYRLISLLSYNSINLSNTLIAPDIRTKADWYKGSEVFGAHGGVPSSAPSFTRKPTKLTDAGVPEWPIPPMVN